MSSTFTAIDFETAQGYRWSICQVGLVRVVDGDVVAKLDLLVKPPYNYYWKNFTAIHGISAKETRNAPTFDEVWPVIEPYITGQLVVAHNSRFDFGCIKSTLEFYDVAYPIFDGECTYKLFGKSLKSLCLEYDIFLNHHNALSDAMACARLFLMHNDIIQVNDRDL
jgi:DNA polymerase III subunit epsilon